MRAEGGKPPIGGLSGWVDRVHHSRIKRTAPNSVSEEIALAAIYAGPAPVSDGGDWSLGY
jgi:hypothetical protein